MANTPNSRSDRRRPHLALPVEPTDDELARNWTLSEADRIEVLRYRGDGSHLRFAIQLCALRAPGRFVNNFITVPVRIANYLGRQLNLPPVLFGKRSPNPDPGVRSGFRCVHPVQIYLDLGAHPERGAEAAAELRESYESWRRSA